MPRHTYYRPGCRCGFCSKFLDSRKKPSDGGLPVPHISTPVGSIDDAIGRRYEDTPSPSTPDTSAGNADMGGQDFEVNNGGSGDWS